MPLWAELMVSLLIVYGAVLALVLPYLRLRRRRALQRAARANRAENKGKD